MDLSNINKSEIIELLKNKNIYLVKHILGSLEKDISCSFFGYLVKVTLLKPYGKNPNNLVPFVAWIKYENNYYNPVEFIREIVKKLFVFDDSKPYKYVTLYLTNGGQETAFIQNIIKEPDYTVPLAVFDRDSEPKTYIPENLLPFIESLSRGNINTANDHFKDKDVFEAYKQLALIMKNINTFIEYPERIHKIKTKKVFDHSCDICKLDTLEKMLEFLKNIDFLKRLKFDNSRGILFEICQIFCYYPNN